MSINAQKVQIKKTEGSYTYLNAGLEQTVLIHTPVNNDIIKGIWLDLTTITQNGTIKLSYKIDGTNYRLVDTIDFTVATDSDGVFIATAFPVNSLFKITYTEGADEGADRAIPYQLFFQE